MAAHPLRTEDTGTQGSGNVELENGLSWSRTDAAKVFMYQPQVSYGMSPALDLIAQPSWSTEQDGGSPRTSGWGDSNLDAKWRFYGDAPLSFGVRAGVALATSSRSLGMARDKVSIHAVLVATYDHAPFTVHGNLGLAQNPGSPGERSRIARVSAAAMWAADERLTVTLDAGAGSNASSARSAWPSTLLAGAIYTIRPGLDVDAGYQSSLRASITMRQWLFGITYRFAP